MFRETCLIKQMRPIKFNQIPAYCKQWSHYLYEILNLNCSNNNFINFLFKKENENIKIRIL